MVQAMHSADTHIIVRFLIHALKLSSGFEEQFQSQEILIHKLHFNLVNLLNCIAVQFIKDDILSSTPVWDIDFADRENQRPLDEILVGNSTSVLLPDNDRKKIYLMKVSVIFSLKFR